MYSDTEQTSLMLTENKKKERKPPENHLCPKGIDRTILCINGSMSSPVRASGAGALRLEMFAGTLLHNSERLSQTFCSLSL